MQRQVAALRRNPDTPDAQLTWFEVFQTDVAFNAIGQWALAASFREAYHFGEFHPVPAGLQSLVIHYS
jgi:hypothetical protein